MPRFSSISSPSPIPPPCNYYITEELPIENLSFAHWNSSSALLSFDPKKEPRMEAELSPDMITTLPQPIIETILCLLPIHGAARTSILAREWRYKWTTIPKIVFDQVALQRESGKVYTPSKLLCAIHQVLLLRQVPIHEFTLSLDYNSVTDYTQSDIDEILLHLARNHVVKRFKLGLNSSSSYNLPLSICNRFGSLTSLSLVCVPMHSETLLQFLSNCPSLKSFSLFMEGGNVLGDKRTTMVELFECLPVVEHLTISGVVTIWLCKSFQPHSSTSNYLRLENIRYANSHEGAFVAVLIKCSPNLEKIEIVDVEDFISDDMDAYSILALKFVRALNLKFFALDFVKVILAVLPKLKRVSILSHVVPKDSESETVEALLHTPRASPAVEINVSFSG